MRQILFAIVLGMVAGASLAKLPPPSPEEKAKADKAKADQKTQTEVEKKLLEQSQEKVARQYRAAHPEVGAPPQGQAQKLKDTDIPAAAKQPSNAPGQPYQGRKAQPQGQAHSSD